MKRMFLFGLVVGSIAKLLALAAWHLTCHSFALTMATRADPLALWLATHVSMMFGDARAIAPTLIQTLMFEIVLVIVSAAEGGSLALLLSRWITWRRRGTIQA